MEINTATKQLNPVTVYFLNLNSITTINSYKFRIRGFCLFAFNIKDYLTCDWSELNYIKVLEFISIQKELNRAHTSINVTLSAIKSVAFHSWQLNIISTDEYLRIKNIKCIKGHRLAAGRTLTLDEINKLRAFFLSSNDIMMKRNHAIFALACGAGLRRRELMLLNVEHILEDKIIVNGKGNKIRTVFLTEFTKIAVECWIKELNYEKGALFISARQLNKDNNRISISGIHDAIHRIVKLSKCKHFTTHDLRRTFATTLLDVGADKFAVQHLMGHTSLATTEIYDRRGDKAMLEAIKLLPF
jgi:site-specific recombinase XerD